MLPTFEGGQEAIDNYFAQSQRRSIQSFRSKVQAEMTVVFNVEMDGTVTGCSCRRGEECRRHKQALHGRRWMLRNRSVCWKTVLNITKSRLFVLMNNMPKWNPCYAEWSPL